MRKYTTDTSGNPVVETKTVAGVPIATEFLDIKPDTLDITNQRRVIIDIIKDAGISPTVHYDRIKNTIRNNIYNQSSLKFDGKDIEIQKIKIDYISHPGYYFIPLMAHVGIAKPVLLTNYSHFIYDVGGEVADCTTSTVTYVHTPATCLDPGTKSSTSSDELWNPNVEFDDKFMKYIGFPWMNFKTEPSTSNTANVELKLKNSASGIDTRTGIVNLKTLNAKVTGTSSQLYTSFKQGNKKKNTKWNAVPDLDIDSDMNLKFDVISKALGDALQVLLGYDFITNITSSGLPISDNDVCMYTNDSVVMILCNLLKMNSIMYNYESDTPALSGSGTISCNGYLVYNATTIDWKISTINTCKSLITDYLYHNTLMSEIINNIDFDPEASTFNIGPNKIYIVVIGNTLVDVATIFESIRNGSYVDEIGNVPFLKEAINACKTLVNKVKADFDVFIAPLNTTTPDLPIWAGYTIPNPFNDETHKVAYIKAFKKEMNLKHKNGLYKNKDKYLCPVGFVPLNTVGYLWNGFLDSMFQSVYTTLLKIGDMTKTTTQMNMDASLFKPGYYKLSGKKGGSANNNTYTETTPNFTLLHLKDSGDTGNTIAKRHHALGTSPNNLYGTKVDSIKNTHKRTISPSSEPDSHTQKRPSTLSPETHFLSTFPNNLYGTKMDSIKHTQKRTISPSSEPDSHTQKRRLPVSEHRSLGTSPNNLHGTKSLSNTHTQKKTISSSSEPEVRTQTRPPTLLGHRSLGTSPNNPHGTKSLSNTHTKTNIPEVNNELEQVKLSPEMESSSQILTNTINPHDYKTYEEEESQINETQEEDPSYEDVPVGMASGKDNGYTPMLHEILLYKIILTHHRLVSNGEFLKLTPKSKILNLTPKGELKFTILYNIYVHFIRKYNMLLEPPNFTHTPISSISKSVKSRLKSVKSRHKSVKLYGSNFMNFSSINNKYIYTKFNKYFYDYATSMSFGSEIIRYLKPKVIYDYYKTGLDTVDNDTDKVIGKQLSNLVVFSSYNK